MLIAVADATRLPLADQCVALTFGSPPYCDARTYDDGTLPDGHTVSRQAREWVDWMMSVTTECLRVTNGPVIWVAAGVTRNRNYWPACEGLMWEWYSRGGSMYRPCYWHRIGIPGSGGDQWFRADVEHVMCFKRPGPLPYANNMAMGRPCRFPIGGAMSCRTKDGQRRNARYSPPSLSNPGTLVRTTNGGGNLGSRLAHENEAPFPEKLAEHFILSLTKPGDIVLDPFSGSGTTAAVASKHGRRYMALDIRASQAALTRRRLSGSQRVMF